MGNESIAVMVERASLKFNKIAYQVLASYCVTPSQFRIMDFVIENPNDSVRQIDIENYFSLTNPTVTGIVQNLEKNGFIKKIPNPNDGRSKVLHITEKGFELQKNLEKLNNEMENRFTEKLNSEEKAQLLALLKKISEK